MCVPDSRSGSAPQHRQVAVISDQQIAEMKEGGQLVFVMDSRVYRLPAEFMHPGGERVLQQHAGQDIGAMFRGMDGHHAHSTAARRLLDRFQIGTLCKEAAAAAAPPGVATREPCTIIDPSRPLAFQVGRLGSQYAQWVHEPEVGSARFFSSSFLEAFTRTPWWFVPLVWGPAVAVGVAAALRRLPLLPTLLALAAGLVAWQLTEYCIHRFVFHREPCSYWGVTLHFLLHGIHHKYPMDKLRLVFPPLPALAVMVAAYSAARLVLRDKDAALAVFVGWLAGYVVYDCFHYAMHHGLPGGLGGHLGRMRGKHLQHHFREPTKGFGISSDLLDVLFGTLPAAVTAGVTASDSGGGRSGRAGAATAAALTVAAPLGGGLG